jgi:hypothetical protein
VRRSRDRVLRVALAAALLAGCAGCADAPAGPPQGRRPTHGSSAGWEITVYYTAVEQYHSGPPVTVTGCPTLDCVHGSGILGTFPKDFVRAVHDEGTGATRDGRYLNWSFDTGYWIDSSTRDTDGRPLTPFVSAAADPDVLAPGTTFTIEDCGSQDDGSAPTALVCSRLRAAHWTITDEFTPGLGGEKHLDAYIGEETGPGFTESDWYLTLMGATVRIGA